MDYRNFLETVKQALREELGDGYQVRVRPIPKNNGITLDGLSIQAPGDLLAPTVYMNPYYQQYRQGMPLPDVIGDILGLFRNNPPPAYINGERLSDYEEMKDRVMLRLIHAPSNRELLSDVPHIPFLDLAIVFYLFLEKNASGQMTALIHNEYKDRWQVDEKRLLELALVNTPAAYPPELKSMEDIMRDLIRQNASGGEKELPEELSGAEDTFSSLYVLSNQSGIYGSCCILYEGVLQELADRLGHDLIIIPSSIHEVLLTPDTEGLHYSYLNELVVTINRQEVPREDHLSDHIYRYARASGQIQSIGAPA